MHDYHLKQHCNNSDVFFYEAERCFDIGAFSNTIHRGLRMHFALRNCSIIFSPSYQQLTTTFICPLNVLSNASNIREFWTATAKTKWCDALNSVRAIYCHPVLYINSKCMPYEWLSSSSSLMRQWVPYYFPSQAWKHTFEDDSTCMI